MSDFYQTNLLLHVCCAPCCGVIVRRLIAEGRRPTLFFYNPNIYPREEYEWRKDSVIRFARKNGAPFIDTDYDSDQWMERVRGLENEAERGRRCRVCFDVRLERAALYAFENKFKIFSSTNGIARWKDIQQVHAAGLQAASRYPGLIYWTRNWRDDNAQQEMYQIAKEERFYKQDYCGCLYSLEQANEFRRLRGLPRVVIGKNFYGV